MLWCVPPVKQPRSIRPSRSGESRSGRDGRIFLFSLFLPPQTPQLTEKTQDPPGPGLCMYALVCMCTFLLTNLKSTSCRKSSSFVDVRCLLQGLLQLKCASYGVGGKKRAVYSTRAHLSPFLQSSPIQFILYLFFHRSWSTHLELTVFDINMLLQWSECRYVSRNRKKRKMSCDVYTTLHGICYCMLSVLTHYSTIQRNAGDSKKGDMKEPRRANKV